MAEVITLLLIGMFVGWIIRGARVKGDLARIKLEARKMEQELEIAKLQTRLEKERFKQDEMLERRSR